MMKSAARILVALVLLFSPGIAFAASPVWTAVVDAGSGGTRLYLYRVIPGPYPVIETKFEKRSDNALINGFKPDDGIDNYTCYTGTDPAAKAFYATANVNQYVMTPLLEAMKAELKILAPAVKPASVPVKVYATAGMRSARETCGPKAVRKLYATIKDGMTAAGFTSPENEARTIDGASEEGLWSFIDANDEFANAFDRPNHPKPRQAMVGIFEVGGSSVQVAYPLPVASSDPKAIKIKINNRQIAVHSESYLHLGQSDMRKALRGYKDANNQLIAYKCWANGFDKAYDKGDEGYPRLTKNGAFNPADPACGLFMHAHLKQYMTTPPNLSQTNAKFVGLGGLKFTLDAFGLLVGPYAGTNNLKTNVDTRCSQDASTWPDINIDENVQFYCPHGAYIAALMTDPRFGIFRQAPAKFDRALVAEDVNNASLTWIKGYLLLNYSK